MVFAVSQFRDVGGDETTKMSEFPAKHEKYLLNLP
jgi:hypothetical protein